MLFSRATSSEITVLLNWIPDIIFKSKFCNSVAESTVSGSFFCGEFFLLVILSSAEWLYEWAESKISTWPKLIHTRQFWRGQEPENKRKKTKTKENKFIKRETEKGGGSLLPGKDECPSSWLSLTPPLKGYRNALLQPSKVKVLAPYFAFAGIGGDGVTVFLWYLAGAE